MDMTIRMKREKLLAAIRQRRDEHHAAYVNALANWRTQMVEIGRQLSEVGDRLRVFPGALLHLTRVPRSYLNDFARALHMVESATDDEISLTQSDYDCLVLGRWQWREQFDATNAAYCRGAQGGEGSLTKAPPARIEDEELEGAKSSAPETAV